MVSLDRAAIPPYTPCSSICSEFVSALEGSDMDTDHVSHFQGHCLAMFVIILLMAPCIHLPKQVSHPVGPPNAVPQFLDIFGGSEHGY